MAAILPADDPAALAKAVAELAAGQLVAVPTETVYGLAADAANGEAVARIFEARSASTTRSRASATASWLRSSSPRNSEANAKSRTPARAARST